MVVLVGGGLQNGFDSTPITAAMLERIHDADATVRLEAIRGLGSLGSKVFDTPPPELTAALDDESEANCEAAAMALATYRTGLPPLLLSIVQAADERSPRYRKALVKLLEQIRGPPLRGANQDAAFGPAAVDGLAAALRSRDPEIRCRAVTALASFREAAGRAAPELARVLEQIFGSQPGSVAVPAGRELEQAIALIDCLREVVVGASKQAEAGAALAKALQPERGTRMRVAAARALGRFREDPAVFRTLTAYILDRDPAVRHSVIWAIHDVDFGQGYTIPMDLARALEDPSPETRVDAAAAICHSGLGGDAFVPALVRHGLHDPSSEVRSMCGTCLAMLKGPKMTRASIPYLVEALDSKDNGFLDTVCQALARYGPDSAAAIPRLISVVKSSTGKQAVQTRRFPIYALCQVTAPNDPEADRVLEVLTEFLKLREDGWITTETLDALAKFGPRARAAIPRIRELQSFDDERVQKSAAAALASIEGKK